MNRSFLHSQALFLLCSALLLLLSGTALCDEGTNGRRSPEEQFQRLHQYYQQLLNTPEGEERENWLRAARGMRELQRLYPERDTAPKSLYLLGNHFHQLYRKGKNPLDLAEAVTSFEDMQATYPRHPLADDALFYLANIFLHEQQERRRAAAALTRLIDLYPEGDMAAAARDKLRDIEQSPSPSIQPSVGDAEHLAAIAELRRQAKEQDRTAPDEAGKGVVGKKFPQKLLSPRTQSSLLRQPAEIMPARHWSSDSYTRVVVEAGGPVAYRSHLRENGGDSQLLYLDLTGARLSSAIEREVKSIEDGLLKEIRHSQLTKDSVRLVLSTQSRISNYQIFNLENPFRVVIDLMGNPQSEARAQPREPTPPVADDSQPLSLAQQLGVGVKRIVIDPGHGGKDPGAVSPSGIKEKDVNLRIARMLAKELRSKGIEVIMTRERDVFLPLEERAAIANSREADLFISIHINSAPAREARGMETYILDMTARDEDAMREDALENAPSTRSYSELQSIVQELLNNTKLQESLRLAESVHHNTLDGLRRVYGERIHDRGVRRAPFVVLIGARMPALMVEAGFISNPEEERLLNDQRYLSRLVEGIAAGVNHYAGSLSASNF